MGLDKASITNTFTAGTTIRSAEVNTNFQDVETPFNSAVDTIDSPPDGFAWDYQISTGIASSDLTVSLLKKDGTSYTTSNKGYIRIANTLLDIDSALSVTLDNADGDYFDWDTGKIQGNDAQLFVYLANNSGTLRIGLSPDPSKVTCGDNRFYSSAQQGSAGHTNGVWSGTVASTDPCRVIGRVRVSQSDADAWQAPTTSETINYPIYSTDWLTWTPPLNTGATISGFDRARYMLHQRTVFFVFQIENKNVTTGGGPILIEAPIDHSSGNIYATSNLVNDGSSWLGTVFADLESNQFNIYKSASATSWSGTETGIYVRMIGNYDV